MIRMSKAVIIGVIYNSNAEVFRFVESIRRCFGQEAEVILVDNSENHPDSLFLEKILGIDFITYIKSETNLGYFHGANFGLKHFSESNPMFPPWIIVCNVDIIFEIPFLPEKLALYENMPDLGVIAPAILSGKWRTDLNPFLMSRIPIQKLHFYRAIYSNVLLQNGYVLLHYLKRIVKMFFHLITDQKKTIRDIPGKIYAPHGSCVILNKRYFEGGGTLDHISFLFGEEIFLGETAKRLGQNVLYVPEIQIRHFEHSSIGSFISSKINKFYRQSIKDIIAAYYKGK
jgi:GT2 family glycosyltransferase